MIRNETVERNLRLLPLLLSLSAVASPPGARRALINELADLRLVAVENIREVLLLTLDVVE